MSDSVLAPTAPPASSGSPAPAAQVTKARSLFDDALRELRRKPLFWVALLLVALVITMAAFPTLFTPVDPHAPGACQLSRQYAPASGHAYFGYDFQGCDIFARTIYGARASVVVGFSAVGVSTVLALLVGLPAGYFGGWIDSLLGRFTDMVLGVPYLLAALVLASRISASGGDNGYLSVILVLGLLGWPTAARVIRASVISSKSLDYVAAARMLGAKNFRIMWRHILPNALAPTVVVLTLALGAYIASEATLSFLNVGLKGQAISWGIDIAAAQGHVRQAFVPLLVPATALAITVLGFIMLGDAIRDAFDPKLQ